MKVRLMRLSIFVALLALPTVPSTATPLPRQLAKTGVHGNAELPLDAQFAISRELGKGQTSYHAVAVEGGYHLANRKHAVNASFLSTGVELEIGSVRWGLALSGYGYGTDLDAIETVTPYAKANYVEYRRGALTEWYVNGPLGIQQGFTLTSAPAANIGQPLTLALTLSGQLKAKVNQGGDGLTLQQTNGESVVRYRGLTAYDAEGRKLNVWLEIAPVTLPKKSDAEIVLVRVDDAGAQYPVVIDPFIQQAKLTVSDGVVDHGFGDSVAISGDTVVVGASGDNSGRGAAYVFVKPGSGWANATETAKLTASDPAHAFGHSVAITDDTIVVGAYNASSQPGAAYVFVKPGSGWANTTETAKLTASDGVAGDFFGYSVGISSDTVVVGAIIASQQGAAYVFVKPGSGWANATETAKLTASDGAAFDEFGYSVGISSDTVVVGATFDDSQRGSAYVFVKPGSGWANATETAKLTASDGGTGDQFGLSVAVSGDTVVVGAFCHASCQGAAYVFVRPVNGWANATETAKLTASDGATGDEFGVSVAVSGDTVVVGAESNNSTIGSAYVFLKPANGWANATESAKLFASDGEANDFFGNAVAISVDTIVVAALGDDSRRGSAYVFGNTRLSQTIIVTQSAPPSAVYNTIFNVAATGGASGNPVVIAASGACAGSGNNSAFITMTSGTGNCTINFNQAGNASYDPAPTITQTTTAQKATPTISISNIPTGAVNGGNFTPTFAYTGDGTISLTSSPMSRCTVSGAVVNFVGGGMCTLTAQATATANVTAATGSQQSFTISPAPTTISINNIPGSAAYGGSFKPTYAYVGNGKTSATSSTPTICSVANNGVVSFISVGTCELTANATASADYLAATGSPHRFPIGKATTTISIKNLPKSAQKNASFTPTYNYVGDGSTFTTSNTPSVCTVSGSTVSFTATGGTCILTAHATAGANYSAVDGNPQQIMVK
jgi:FG-GAP repeat